MQAVAILLGAGRGERLGASVPKALVPLRGRPLIVHALTALLRVAEIERILPVVAAPELAAFRAVLRGCGAGARVAEAVAGGAQRQDSVRAGLAALDLCDEDVAVVVHDAARPCVRPDAIRRVLAAARESGAAILAVPVRDTIKEVAGGRVLRTPPRESCWAAQTPQVFRLGLLRRAHVAAAEAGFVGSDDAQLVERIGGEVRIAVGDRDNHKVTDPEDLVWAERQLAEAEA